MGKPFMFRTGGFEMKKTMWMGLLPAGALALSGLACGVGGAPEATVNDTTFAEVCNQVGERVRLQGYPVLPDTVYEDDSYYDLYFYEDIGHYEDSTGDPHVWVRASIGSGANEVERVDVSTEQFSDTDLALHVSEGDALIEYGDSARVSGDVVEADGTCRLENIVIEQ
jgi:hypothetical protein